MAILRVQKAENDAGGSTTSTITVTLPAATTAGNLLVAHVFDDNGDETITAPAGWTLITKQGTSGDNCSALFYYANNPGGLTSFTFTRAGAQIWAMSAVVIEYSGIATASPLDVHDLNFGNSATAGGGSLVTTNAADLLIFAAGAGGSSISSVSAGWTMLENHPLYSGTGAAIAERIVAATGTYTPTMPLSGSSLWEGITAAFKAASGGSTPITVPTDAATGTDSILGGPGSGSDGLLGGPGTGTDTISVGTGWIDADVGGPAGAGSASLSAGVWTQTGGGNGIENTNEQFNFNYQTLAGDGDLIMRATAWAGPNQYAKLGLMMRASLTAGDASCMVVLQWDWNSLADNANSITFDVRATSGAAFTNPGGGTLTTLPRWFKLSRSGTSFSAYHSSDGITWTQISTAQSIPALSGTLFVGAVATSTNLNTSSTTTESGTYDNLSVSTGGATPITVPTDAATGTDAILGEPGSGSDSTGVTAAVPVPTDAGAGSDTGQPTITTAVPLADAGAGIDSILADAGAGADSPGITAAIPLATDPATGADAILGGGGTGGDSTGVGVTLAPPTDGASGGDTAQPTISAAIPLANDPGLGNDSVTVQQSGGNQSPQVADSALGTDSILAEGGTGTDSAPGIGASFTQPDAGTGGDAGQPSVGASFTQADTASGGDAGNPSALSASVPLATDGATGADTLSALAASFTQPDAGAGTDAPAGVQVIIPALAEPATGLDAAPTISAAPGIPTDAATGGTVVGSPAVQAPVGDPAGGGDALAGVPASVPLPTDAASGGDFSSVPQGSNVAVTLPDAAAGTDVALLAFRWRGPRILGATTEQGAVIARAGRGTNPNPNP